MKNLFLPEHKTTHAIPEEIAPAGRIAGQKE
jgi:hypothetical protein